MARQARTRQPKTKFVQKHQLKCSQCGLPTSHFDIITVDGRPKVVCKLHDDKSANNHSV